MTDWVRLWHDMPTDPKWRTIARKSGQPLACVIALFTYMMTEASAAADRGSISGLNVEDAATALDMDEESVASILDAMQGRVIEGGRLSGWERRQPKKEDGAADRAKAWREQKKSLAEVQERARTLPNATERPETDTDTDTESGSESERPTISREPAAPSAEASLRVAIAGAYSAAGSPTPPDTSRAAIWLASGWPPDLCVAVIREGLGRRGSAPRSLAYFEPAIRDRIAGNAVGRAGARAPPRRAARTMTEALIDADRRDAHDEPASDPKIIDAIAVSG